MIGGEMTATQARIDRMPAQQIVGRERRVRVL